MQQKYVRREDTTACQAHAVPPLPRSSSPTWDEKLKEALWTTLAVFSVIEFEEVQVLKQL